MWTWSWTWTLTATATWSWTPPSAELLALVFPEYGVPSGVQLHVAVAVAVKVHDHDHDQVKVDVDVDVRLELLGSTWLGGHGERGIAAIATRC